MRPLSLSDRLYRSLLHIYPAAFQERFANEMAQVFYSLSREVYAKAGQAGLLRLWLRVMWDGIGAALTQWRLTLFKRRDEKMQANPIDRSDGVRSLTPFQAFLAALPFLLSGLSSFVTHLETFNSFYPPFPPGLALWKVLIIQPGTLVYWLVLIGLGAGLMAGFPRWAVTYLGWALVLGWSYGNTSIYGHYLREMWLPLAAVVLLVILIRRSLQPLRDMFSTLWADWTLPSLGLYIFYAPMGMMYDENHHPLLLTFIAVTTVALSLGAWGYFRTSSPIRRVLALAGGMTLAAFLSGLSWATWDYRAYYGLPEGGPNDLWVSLIFATVITVLFMGNALLARWRNGRAAA